MGHPLLTDPNNLLFVKPELTIKLRGSNLGAYGYQTLNVYTAYRLGVDTLYLLCPSAMFDPYSSTSTTFLRSRGSTARSREKPLGRKDSPSCILGNLLACRALVLLVICATRGIWWILEQPMTSVMQYHPMFQRVVRMLGMHKLVISMANYGGPTDKKTILYSSSSIQNRSKLFGKGFYFWPI